MALLCFLSGLLYTKARIFSNSFATKTRAAKNGPRRPRACTWHLGPLQVPKPWRCGAGLPGMQAQAKRKAAVLQNSRFVWRCRPDLNWCIEVLQTSALPLGYGTICKFRRHEKRRNSIWSGLRGSNSLPPPWQGGALPDELKPQMVPPIGIEPMTRGFSVPCSTN